MGLDKVVQEWFPNADHRRCGWHLFNNFRGRFPGTLLAKYFWAAARSCTLPEFNVAMEKIKELNDRAHSWLTKLPTKMCRHAFPLELKSDHLTNNHTESFNAWLAELREKSICVLLDGIRKRLMERTQQKHKESERWRGKLCKNIRLRLDKVVDQARVCNIIGAENGEFEVIDMDLGKTYTIRLRQGFCSCRIWMVSGIPCKHVACAVIFERKDLEDYVAKCYHKKMYVVANGEYIIHPIDDETNWGPGIGTAPEPPRYARRQAGRPQNARKRNLNLEEPARSTKSTRSGAIKCKKCNTVGTHNSRTCGRKPVKKMTAEEKRYYWDMSNRYNSFRVNLEAQFDAASNNTETRRDSGLHESYDVAPTQASQTGGGAQIAACGQNGGENVVNAGGQNAGAGPSVPRRRARRSGTCSGVDAGCAPDTANTQSGKRVRRPRSIPGEIGSSSQP